jgi:hypothetical protein
MVRQKGRESVSEASLLLRLLRPRKIRRVRRNGLRSEWVLFMMVDGRCAQATQD